MKMDVSKFDRNWITHNLHFWFLKDEGNSKKVLDFTSFQYLLNLFDSNQFRWFVSENTLAVIEMRIFFLSKITHGRLRAFFIMKGNISNKMCDVNEVEGIILCKIGLTWIMPSWKKFLYSECYKSFQKW